MEATSWVKSAKMGRTPTHWRCKVRRSELHDASEIGLHQVRVCDCPRQHSLMCCSVQVLKGRRGAELDGSWGTCACKRVQVKLSIVSALSVTKTGTYQPSRHGRM
jgi:hypothetical protein